MSAPALVGAGRPTLRIRGTPYPVLLPTVRDPRLHLAAVIVSLQVLGQAAFGFSLSIAQILIALGTSAVLEFGIAAWRQRVIMWPASALLTGNGVAFVLRVPGTHHGDWWSTRGAWIFAATAAVSLLSKHLVRFHGRHVFNPSNFGLVLCFLALGSNRAEPLDFWWAPMSTWLALALAIIVAGGFGILLRLGLLGIAVRFWLAFAAGIGLLALTGHAMTARWHLGPITNGYFWWLLVSSPEVLVFLFFMLTDPKTIPASSGGRRAYAVAVGLLAALLIAPQRTEFASKVALLGALAIVCAARPLFELLRSVRADRFGSLSVRRPALTALVGTAGVAGLLVLAGIPARTSAGAANAPLDATGLPKVTILPSKGVSSQLNRLTGLHIARDAVADLRSQADAIRRRDTHTLGATAGGAWLASLQKQIDAAGSHAVEVPVYRIERLTVHLEPGRGQAPPTVVAKLDGLSQVTTYSGAPEKAPQRGAAVRFEQTLELRLEGDRFVIVGSRGAPTRAPSPAPAVQASPSNSLVTQAFRRVHLTDVASAVGLDFNQGAFHYTTDPTAIGSDPVAMMGGGLCWLDYNNDGWLDLFVVNSYAYADGADWEAHGGLPHSALFENLHGRFVDVSARSHADPALKGTGCVAADFNGDGYTDLYESTGSNDVLLWNNGNGTFSDGTQAAGINGFGWHSGAAVADVNGDGRPDLFVAGYADPNAPVPGSAAGFPTNLRGVPDLLYLNEGNDKDGHARFREVGKLLRLDSRLEHGLGAVFTDVNGDGRPDLYVANDEDPNRLYVNMPRPGGAKADPLGLGFRLVDMSKTTGVADRNAGMGIAAADYNGDGATDLFVSNSRDQQNALFRSELAVAGRASFANAKAATTAAFGHRSTAGWGTSWVDLDNDGAPDLVLANGAIPIVSLKKGTEPIQVLENLELHGSPGQFADASSIIGSSTPPIIGRGLAAADYDNNGTVDIAINTIGGPLVLLKNTGETGHWLEVSLGRFAPGALVTAVLPDGRRLVREVQAGSSYLSSEDPRVHFGLGQAARLTALVVRYPDGRETRLTDVAADRIVNIK